MSILIEFVTILVEFVSILVLSGPFFVEFVSIFDRICVHFGPKKLDKKAAQATETFLDTGYEIPAAQNSGLERDLRFFCYPSQRLISFSVRGCYCVEN